MQNVSPSTHKTTHHTQAIPGLATTLQMSHIPTEDRDFALFALLLNSSEKALVFVNSIAMLKRLGPLLTLLRIQCVSMHAQMQQRARLKAIERFIKGDANVMLATDVVGRGIDLPQVDTVVHFQLPPSKDSFIHRSGRAGRAGRARKVYFVHHSGGCRASVQIV